MLTNWELQLIHIQYQDVFLSLKKWAQSEKKEEGTVSNMNELSQIF